MDGVLEKITLYDILGYLVPGSLLMMLILGGIGQEKMLSYLKQWGDYKGALYFTFLLISYLVGIALSEAMAWVWNCKRFMALIQKVRKCLKKENKILDGISNEQIANALEKSGISENNDLIKSHVENNFMEHYFSYVYGFVQKSDDYKRVHNYASAYVLYKNVTGALLLGGIVVLFNKRWIGILCIVMSVVFLIRGVKFQDKKNGYAVIWFVEKFTNKIGKSTP